MPRYLLFRLFGPMAAWGDIAVGERRPSQHQPTKSAVLGLVAGALGVRRDDEAALARIHAGYGFACRVDAAPVSVTDYHTVQTAPTAALKGKSAVSRKDELSIPSHALKTILSSRDYLQDTASVVALWENDGAPSTLEEIASALERPHFTPYLGRKSCPPALPFAPRIAGAENPVAALKGADFGDASFLEPLEVAARRFHWDGDFEGVEPLETVRRRDQAGSRVYWQFFERTEHIAREE